ncbi:MAG: class II fumarate hydratase [Clostridia bacterium]|nr:class II fumarate hydratase [Clostridia bacterium]
MDFRKEHDTMGEVLVPADRLWGAQTQRSFDNFKIGTEKMPKELIEAMAYVKWACAKANNQLGKLDDARFALIEDACRAILAGELAQDFPLAVWQTGSGTQTNMNVNEVIANFGNAKAGEKLLHPNDHANMSQSSNDTFPTALNVAAILMLKNHLLPALDEMIEELRRIEEENPDVVTTGRTHLQDAVPIRFCQEVYGWRGMLENARDMIEKTMPNVGRLAIGGTAVGTGLNAPKGFDVLAADAIADLTGIEGIFTASDNKFHALTALDSIAASHGALKALASNLMKIANDVRHLASGPRCGLGEIFIPENEPGSSIMPGKVNPTQCEALTMCAVQVMGNDTAIGIAASQGNFQLNVYQPVTAYNYVQSVRLLSDAMHSFVKNCLRGLRVNEEKMHENLHRSLMTVTALNVHIGYENAAKVAKYAHANNTTIREAVLALSMMEEAEFDRIFHPEHMA